MVTWWRATVFFRISLKVVARNEQFFGLGIEPCSGTRFDRWKQTKKVKHSKSYTVVIRIPDIWILGSFEIGIFSSSDSNKPCQVTKQVVWIKVHFSNGIWIPDTAYLFIYGQVLEQCVEIRTSGYQRPAEFDKCIISFGWYKSIEFSELQYTIRFIGTDIIFQ